MKSIAIDEDGFPLFDEKRINHEDIGREILENTQFFENAALGTFFENEKYLVEAFDDPFVAQNIELSKFNSEVGQILLPYGLKKPFKLHEMTLDEWDRFHGVTIKNQIPFVLSRQAQAEFFNTVSEFDDEGFSFAGKNFKMKSHLKNEIDKEVDSPEMWTEAYLSGQDQWNMQKPAPALCDMLPRLKIPRSRVLVPGCGTGHDAALLAQDGHMVTAIDFSEEALTRGKKQYGHLTNINWVRADFFEFAKQNPESFDFIFEHTFFCAINPLRRDELIRAWRRLLSPGGTLLAVLFTMYRKSGPPFGGTEWEYRQRLKNQFRFLLWGRWRQSSDQRQGKELLVYAQKKD